MALVKHSERTVRSGCSKCGDTALYWAHDTDITTGNRPMARNECDKCHVRGGLVLVDKNMGLHQCSGPRFTKDIRESSLKTEAAPPTEVKAEAKAEHTDDGMAALAAMIKPHLQNMDGVEADIEKMVADAWAKRAVPTRVEVRKEDGELKTIEGTQHKVLPLVLRLLSAKRNVMMVGPAGTGKSTIAEQSAEVLSVAYYAISLSPQTPASALLGYMNATGDYVRSLFREWFEHGGIFHFDEMDNAHPSILATINAALANGVMAFPDGMVKKHHEARAAGSANTYGRGADRKYVGRSPIDAATLDRFFIVNVDYDEALEDALCVATGYNAWNAVVNVVRGLRKNAVNGEMTVVVSPRASMDICVHLHSGGTWEECIDGRLRRGLGDADWLKLSNGVKVALV